LYLAVSKAETAAVFQLYFSPGPPRVGLHNGALDGKADPRASLLRREKRIKDVVQFLRRSNENMHATAHGDNSFFAARSCGAAISGYRSQSPYTEPDQYT
jgi:hypothetical protein